MGRSGRELLEEKLGYIWSVHLHNQWKKMFPVGGWMMRLLDGYEVQLKESRRSGRMKRDASGEELVVADLEVDREELVSNSLS